MAPTSSPSRYADDPEAELHDRADGGPVAGSARPDERAVPTALTDRTPVWAARTVGLLALVAAAFYLWIGRAQWFFQDEWVFLADRDGGDLHDVLRPHNEHWVTVPLVIYRLLWRALGLQHYEIYQLLPIAAHVASGGLLWLIMRRAQVGPWIATAAAAAFLFFADVSQDITWAFQITFMGAVAFGLAHLVLADHDGPIGRRDATGVGMGLISIMCAATGALMIPIVGLSTWLRRGWRAAALHTVPTVAVYLTWVLTAGRAAQDHDRAGAGPTLRFVERGARTALTRFTGTAWLGVAMVLVVSAGLLVAWRREGRSFIRRAAAPISMTIGAVTMLAVTGANRALPLGVAFATRPRYSHVVMALTLPILAVGVDALVRRWHRLALPLCALLVAGIPVTPRGAPVMQDPEAPPGLILALAGSPGLAGAPRWYQPFPNRTGARAITAGWLQDSVAEGRIPLMTATPEMQTRVDELLTLAIDRSPASIPPCRPFTEPVTRVLEKGEGITLRGGVLFTTAEPGGPQSAISGTGQPEPFRLVAIRGPLEVWVGPFRRASGTAICER